MSCTSTSESLHIGLKSNAAVYLGVCVYASTHLCVVCIQMCVCMHVHMYVRMNDVVQSISTQVGA